MVESARYTVLIADDEPDICGFLKDLLSTDFKVELASRGDTALAMIPEVRPDILLLDLGLPGKNGIEVLNHIRDNQLKLHVIVLTASSDIRTAILAMKLGAFDFIQKPFDIEHLLMVIENVVEKIRLATELTTLRNQLASSLQLNTLVASSEQMRSLFLTISKVIDTDSTILISGESGTGKGLLARAIHCNSARREHPFLALDLAVVPPDLAPSELFGHERGAFTGAVARKLGKFESAGQGTLFLDEISNLTLEMQAKLLRVLQEKEFERIGGNALIPVRARIIAATNRDLSMLVREGLFREDLYYRLNVVPLALPPLSQRRDDIPLLIDHFVKKFTEEYNRPVKISPGAKFHLQKMEWPGNVRQLENVVRRLVLLSEEATVTIEDIEAILRLEKSTSSADGALEGISLYNSSGCFRTMDDLEREIIIAAIGASGYNLTSAARMLGISRKTIHNKIKSHKIELKISFSDPFESGVRA